MISTKEQIIEYFQSGIKEIKNFKIGIEHEKFLFNNQDNKRINYLKIKEMFSALQEFGWNPILEKQNIIGLYKGEKTADIHVKSVSHLKSINCPSELNSAAIDEFLIIFLAAAKAKGVSSFRNLTELNQKESPRLKWGAKILNMMGIKTILKKDSIKIFGNPNLKIKKKIIIKEFLKDHRVFMTSVIAALTFGGSWKIFNQDAIDTSFPSFLKKLKDMGAKFN